MISRTMAADLPSRVGEHVQIAGWLHRKRQLKSMTFLIVRDRSGLAQAVLTGWSILLVLGGALQIYLSKEEVKKALFDVLTDYAMFGAVSFETLAVASIFICRRQYPG